MLPGFILVAVLSFISTYISQYFHIGSIAIVIFLGLLYSNILGLKETFLLGVDFSEKQVMELRGIMEESLATGARADTLVKDLQARFAISERKAKFLAKQETRLLTTQYYHERATVAGCKRFRWSTSHDFRVRDLHKHLDGKVFSVDNLPVIHTGKNGDERGMPAQAFGCRCRAIYLFDWGSYECRFSWSYGSFVGFSDMLVCTNEVRNIWR